MVTQRRLLIYFYNCSIQRQHDRTGDRIGDAEPATLLSKCVSSVGAARKTCLFEKDSTFIASDLFGPGCS